jgi:uncharacterized membrane protein (UPF0136 family)
MAVWLILVFAIMMLGGGVAGYKAAGSRASLISGVASAVLLAGAFFLARDNEARGLAVAAGLSAVLAVVFALRVWKTRKFMPAGMLLLLSVLAAGFFAISSQQPM